MEVKIIQISSSMFSVDDASGEPIVEGLGEDGKIYYWDRNEIDWRLYK